MFAREWPVGHRLFTHGDLHLSFDPPCGQKGPAVLMTLEGNIATILAVKAFDNDADALAWFAGECKKRLH